MVTIRSGLTESAARSAIEANSLPVGRWSFWALGMNFGGRHTKAFQSFEDKGVMFLRRQDREHLMVWLDTYVTVKLRPSSVGTEAILESHARFLWAGTIGLAAIASFLLMIAALSPGPGAALGGGLTGAVAVLFWFVVRGRREHDLRHANGFLRPLLKGVSD